jgi:hypothetical protein
MTVECRQNIWKIKMTATTSAILHQIMLLGYAVRLKALDGAVEIKAIKSDGSGADHIARCGDGTGDAEVYRAACLLAEAVGIELEDG